MQRQKTSRPGAHENMPRNQKQKRHPYSRSRQNLKHPELKKRRFARSRKTMNLRSRNLASRRRPGVKTINKRRRPYRGSKYRVKRVSNRNRRLKRTFARRTKLPKLRRRKGAYRRRRGVRRVKKWRRRQRGRKYRLWRISGRSGSLKGGLTRWKEIGRLGRNKAASVRRKSLGKIGKMGERYRNGKYRMKEICERLDSVA